MRPPASVHSFRSDFIGKRLWAASSTMRLRFTKFSELAVRKSTSDRSCRIASKAVAKSLTWRATNCRSDTFKDGVASSSCCRCNCPGRARLATIPCPTGSVTLSITAGILMFDRLAANVALSAAVTIRCTCSLVSSAKRSSYRSSLASAKRRSIMTFFPSTNPLSRNPFRNAWPAACVGMVGSFARKPIR